VLPPDTLGKPGDIADLHSSPARSVSGWIRGQMFVVDCGFLAGHDHYYRLAREGV